MNRLKRFFQPEPPQGEPMTDAKVDFSFGVYWAKMAHHWNSERRAAVRQQVLTLTEAVDFYNNLIEKRYTLPLDDVPEQRHSGASLKALLQVLTALDNLEESEKKT